MTTNEHPSVPAVETDAPPEGGCTHHPASPATDDAGPAALVCLREGLAEITFWRDRAQAEEADRVLAPCGERCQLAHEIVESLGAERFRVTQPSGENT